MKTITVKLDEKPVIISKLPIGRYAELIKVAKALPRHLSGMDKMDNEAIFAKLPEIITDALPEFIEMLAIATPLKKEEIEELGFAEIVKLVVGVMEVNCYMEVYEMIKKALAQPKAPVESLTS